MPIKIPNGLPAIAVLQSEQVFVMTEERAVHQDIRPLELLFLNLMPKKINTEIQYMRRLSNTPIQVNITLLRIDDHKTRNTPNEHLKHFYKSFEEVEHRYFDGMIITGAPLDQKDFSDVTYWERLTNIIKWSATHVTSTLFSCWAVCAAFKVFYGLDPVFRETKLSGVFEEHINKNSFDTLIRGFDDSFYAPHSRWVDFTRTYVRQNTDLLILADGKESGMYLGVSPDRRQVYVTGHPEYDADTLADEYRRDKTAGLHPSIPCNYFLNDDPGAEVSMIWRSHASILFSNWINYYVYQMTPFEFGK
ncbi:MAG TPA: homoserine O-succinyltransferase [Succinivibrionaceae bacterium]|nr:homoserine O-succinyltransferase [Succinivibrionaceae bacterium]